ncbi:hypothetical protein [Pricia antarctica]|uniref:hypothetical protein n=1 Tax=Pricia antarctica TaxID=641691 RepID=UPI0011137F14|nr:hypothetical protein [Pricia antarctica]
MSKPQQSFGEMSYRRGCQGASDPNDAGSHESTASDGSDIDIKRWDDQIVPLLFCIECALMFI